MRAAQASGGRSLLVAALVGLLSLPLGGCRPGSEPTADHTLAGGQALPPSVRASVPIDLSAGWVLALVRVNGSGPFRAILDTGMPFPGVILFHRESGEEAGLEYAGIDTLPGAGTGEPKTAFIAEGVTLSLGEVDFEDQVVVVLDESRAGSELEVDGIIGKLLFDHYLVELDFDDEVMRLHDRATFGPAEAWTEVLLEFDNDDPVVHALVELGNGATVRTRLVVDVGAAPYALQLDLDPILGVAPPSPSREGIVGRGLVGAIHGYWGRVEALHLGTESLGRLVTVFPSSKDEIGRASRTANGSLGLRALERFNLVFDYGGRRLYLRPSRLGDRPFDMNMAGLSFDRRADGLREVDWVFADSPASETGIEVGDLLTTINGEPATEYDYGRFRDVFRREGATLELTFERGGETRAVTLRLRRLV